VIVTPMLFIFAETLPKDLFSAHADKLVYPFARLLAGTMRLFTIVGLLPLITAVCNAGMRMLGTASAAGVYHPRLQVQTLVKEGVGEGVLSEDQSVIVERVMSLGSLRVRDEMQPWHDVRTVGVGDPPALLWDLADQTSLSRFPVVDAGGKVVGVVSVYDLVMHDRDTCPPIDRLMNPPVEIPADTPLREGLARLRHTHAPMAIVTEPGRPVGVVTMKDLIEPITGELVSW